MKELFLLLLLGALAGCAAAPQRPLNLNLSGFPAAYRQGYRAGCESARSWDGVKRDEARFKAGGQYTQGWRDGFDICGKR